MPSRRAVVAGLLFLTLLAGGILFVFDSSTLRSKSDAWWSQWRGSLTLSSSQLADQLTSKLNYFVKVLVANKELTLYGGVALIGILIMGLAIGNASSKPRKDTTESMVELLRQEKEKAENLAKLKSEFLNQVSHELRTPLAVIIGYIECITDGLYGNIEAKHQEILQVVAKQSSHLKNMIDQILIYSRLESSRQPVRIEEFHLSKIIGDLRETFDFLCRQKGLELHWELSKGVTEIRSDAERLKEALSNLLQNAVKYTDKGSITVRVREQSATDSIVLEVADTGMGIPEHCLQTIFEPFVQVHKTSTENSRGGIGLGLSIVKKHLEQIKGTITVESELGKGSIFRITIPRIYEHSEARHRKLLRLLKGLHRSEVSSTVTSNGTTKIQAAAHIPNTPWLN
jgi:signal transduction histidine kinase